VDDGLGDLRVGDEEEAEFFGFGFGHLWGGEGGREEKFDDWLIR